MPGVQLETLAGAGALAVLLVDSCPLMREGLRAVSERLDFVRIAAEAPSAGAAFAACQERRFDIVLIGDTLDDRNPVATAAALAMQAPGLRVIICYERFDAQEAARMLQLGIRGLVNRSSSLTDIAEALRQVAAGGVYVPELKSQPLPASLKLTDVEGGLSIREAQVLRLLALGYSNKGVANQLNLSVRTVETHRLNLRQKSGASRPHELQELAQRLGLLDPRGEGPRERRPSVLADAAPGAHPSKVER